MTSSPRYGITIPFDGVPLPDHREWFSKLVDLGYTDVWSAEVDGVDGFTPLTLAAAWEPRLNLGVAIIPAFTRGPALLAQTIAGLAEAAPGRFTFGLGASSQVIVERWNGIAFEAPFQRVKDTLEFLRLALSGEKVDFSCPSFTVRGFKLARPVDVSPNLFVAALRPQMLRLATTAGDGAILNWLSSDDVRTVVDVVGTEAPLTARIFVLPTEDKDLARFVGRRMITAYLNVEAYAQFHRWLGRGNALEPMWEAWASGDRKRALEVIPDEVVDALIINGSYASCREQIDRYIENGVTIPNLAIIPVNVDLAEAVTALSPSAR
jgi:probable F420-dependent oxidoreductase